MRTLHQSLSNFGYAFRLMLTIYKTKFIFKMILNILGTIIGFFSYSYMLRYVVNGIQEGRTFDHLIVYILCMLMVNILFKILNVVYDSILAPVIDKRSSANLQKKLFEKSIEMDIDNYEQPHSYDLYKRALSMGVEALENSMEVVNRLMQSIVQLALSSWLIMLIDPWLFFFPLIPLLMNGLNLKIDTIWIEQKRKERSIDRRKGYTRRVFYQKEYAHEMRLTGISNVMLRDFRKATSELIALIKTSGVKSAVLYFLLSYGTNVLSILGAEAYAVYRTLVSGTVMVGDCLVILNSIGDMTNTIQNFARLFSWIHEISLNIQDYRTFIEKEPKIAENPNGIMPAPGDIEFRDVSFRYEGAARDTIAHLNMKIRQGEKIAIVGENGAGKTTLVKLLLRLYDVTEGTIQVGNLDIRQYRLKDYRSMFGVVFQDSKQLALSIAENLLGREYTDKDKKLVLSALDKVGIRVEELPNGIHSILTNEFDEAGVVLSTGQAQLLSIASIYARESDIVILDEPSSALDPLVEHRMYKTMLHACANKTTIFITHRLSGAVDADRIYLLENGAVAECGTHAQLMALGEKYSKMFQMQAENYRAKKGGVNDENQ